MFDPLFKSIFKEITHHLRFNTLDNIECSTNTSGDVIKKIDIDCEKIFINYIEKNMLNIIGYISEETENLTYISDVNIDYLKDTYIVAFDPLDGSSNYSSNINTGSIYAIYKFDKIANKLLDIVHSGYCLYGINSVMVYTDKNSVIMSVLNGWDNFINIQNLHFNTIINKTKTYSINESNDYDPEIRFLLQQYKNKKYNMRWVGTLVADAHRILLNDGIFYYPTNIKYPKGKIRMLYESIPIAYIYKLAGGIGLNSANKNILDIISTIDINNPHETSAIILASNTEYNILMTLLELYETNKH
jgi:fructose-1,6-bisphosphatase I